MFKIKKEEIIETGKCWYEDAYGNTAFFQKKDDSFVGKLRFADRTIKTEPIVLEIPLREENINGVKLKLNIQMDDERLQTDSIKNAISDFMTKLQYWVNMMYDIKILEKCKNSNDEELQHIYLETIMKYEELSRLKSIINSLIPTGKPVGLSNNP